MKHPKKRNENLNDKQKGLELVNVKKINIKEVKKMLFMGAM